MDRREYFFWHNLTICFDSVRWCFHTSWLFVLQSTKGKEIEGDCASKRRKAPLGHFHDVVSPTQFCKVIRAPGLELLRIPPACCHHLGDFPKEIVLKTNTCRVIVVGRDCEEVWWTSRQPASANCHPEVLKYVFTCLLVVFNLLCMTITAMTVV